MGRSPLALALLGVAAAHGSPHPRRSGHGGALLFAPAALPRGPGHARRPSLCGDPLGSSSARQHARTREPALGPALQLARGRYGPRWQSVATHMLSADDSESARAAKLDLRFYDLVERSERNVDQIERAEVLLKTGFELDGTILRNQQGERVDPETLRGTSVALFFSADWCPDCQNFLPLLRSYYEQQNAPAPARNAPGAEARSKVTIVYVSSDTSKDAADACFREKHGDWLTVDYDSPLRQEYKQRHGIWAGRESSIFATTIEAFQSRRSGIPALAVLTPRGELANFLDAESLGLECLLQWRPEDYKWDVAEC